MIRAVLAGGPGSLLSGLLLFCVAGCLTGPASRPDADSPGSDAVPGDPEVAPLTPEALFILQGADLRTPAWPQQYSGYSLFVCNPSLSADDVETIRRDVPRATVLAYVNLQDLRYHQSPESPYWSAFGDVFDSTQCVRDRPTGRVLRVQGYTGAAGSGLPHAIPHPRNLEILVRFHADVTMAAGFDGLYLDQSNKVYPPWRRAAVQSQSSNFDCDADGFADTVDQLAEKWASGRAVLTYRLRQELGSSAILIANSGGALGDPNLNGITLEGVGKRFTLAQARDFLLAQKLVSRTPFLAVGWVTSAESAVPTQTLVSQVPGTHYGRVPQYPH